MNDHRIDCDFMVLGAGIVGLSIARALKARHGDSRVLLLEKEARPGLHASGRNSGVLHSGIYYPADSVKAKVCAEGARLMAAFCDEHGLPIARIGKVIVPVQEDQDGQIDLLYERARTNGATVTLLDQQGLHDLEPDVRSASGRALHSPNTAVVDPKAVVRFLADSLQRDGVDIRYGCSASEVRPDESIVVAGGVTFRYGHLFNATGQFADLTARQFGLSDRYALLPFKGIYYRLDPDSGIRINGLIYPVPDMNMPFLGVHSVKSIDGTDYFGPTAVPAFGREHYHGLSGIRVADAADIAFHLTSQYIRNLQSFRAYMHAEAGRFLKKHFARAASQLVPKVRSEYLLSSSKVGIRAQLLDKETHCLVMDFLVERRDNTTHVLNAVSPAFTSAFSFAELVLDA